MVRSYIHRSLIMFLALVFSFSMVDAASAMCCDNVQPSEKTAHSPCHGAEAENHANTAEHDEHEKEGLCCSKAHCLKCFGQIAQLPASPELWQADKTITRTAYHVDVRHTVLDGPERPPKPLS